MSKLTELDKKILEILAPELGGATGPAPGHDFKYILLPVSHRFAESPEDFGKRIDRLNNIEFNYLIDRILEKKEDVCSLSDGDFDELVKIAEKRLSEDKFKKLEEMFF